MKLSIFFDDLLICKKRIGLIYFLIFSEFIARYKRTFFGPLWQTFLLTSASFGIGFVWTKIYAIGDNGFIFLIASGFYVWSFCSSIISESTDLYENNKGYLLNYNLPPIFLNLMCVLRNLIFLLHNFLVFTLLSIIFNLDTINFNLALFPFVFFIFFISFFLISTVISIACIYYKDVSNLIKLLLPFLFFISPVLFKAELLINKLEILKFNPIFHYINSFRLIYVNEVYNFNSILFITLFAFITLFIVFILYKFSRKNINLYL